MERVSRISVQIGTEIGESTLITLYRNNTKLAEISNRELCIPDFGDSDADRNKYQSYCKDVVINLLDNDGIAGYYYKPKEEINDGEIHTYTSSTFVAEASKYIDEILSALLEGTDIEFDINKYNDNTTIGERYKNGGIKYGNTIIGAHIDTHQIEVPVEIKSGQMCKPKEFMCGGIKYQLNITSINRMLRVGK